MRDGLVARARAMLFAATGGMQVYFVCAPQRNGSAIEVLKSKIKVLYKQCVTHKFVSAIL